MAGFTSRVSHSRSHLNEPPGIRTSKRARTLHTIDLQIRFQETTGSDIFINGMRIEFDVVELHEYEQDYEDQLNNR